MRWAEFYFSKVQELAAAGVKVVVQPTYLIEGAFRGYCGDTELVMAGTHEEFDRTFVHEYSHFLQRFYRVCKWDATAFWYDVFDSNVSYELGPDQFRYVCEEIQKCEVDADKTAVKLMKKHKLPIDIKTCIRSANAYHLSYSYLAEIGEYHCVSDRSKAPFIIDDYMPDTFLKSYELTSEYRALFDELRKHSILERSRVSRVESKFSSYGYEEGVAARRKNVRKVRTNF